MSAIGITADFHNLITLSRIEVHVRELVTPADPVFSAGVCVAEVSKVNHQELLDKMHYEHGTAGSTAGGFRLCPYIYNTHEHIDRAIEGVKRLRRLVK